MAWITTWYMNHSLNLSRITLEYFCVVACTRLAVFSPWKKRSVVKLAAHVHNWELQTERSTNTSLHNLQRSVFENKCKSLHWLMATHFWGGPSLGAARLRLGPPADGARLKYVHGLCFSHLIMDWLNTQRCGEKGRESAQGYVSQIGQFWGKWHEIGRLQETGGRPPRRKWYIWTSETAEVIL